jgi:superfamily I DNA/RNA helicase
MSLSIVLHPDVVSFLGEDLNSEITGNVWGCIEKLTERQFDRGLRVKKLKGINEKVWEARINKASRLIFTYKKSIRPDTGKPQTYIAVQDICLDHDDVSRRARARKINTDSQWLDADVVEMIGNIDFENTTPEYQNHLNQILSKELENPQIDGDFVDELLGNIQWRVVESEEEWHKAIVQKDGDLPLKLSPEEYELVNIRGNLLLSGSAGTGKTTVGLYRLWKSLDTLKSEKRLYVAYNKILVSNSKEQFARLTSQGNVETKSIFHFKTIKDLCLDILILAGESYRLEDEVTYQVFHQIYSRLPEREKPYPSSFIWDEIRSIIKGAHLEIDSKDSFLSSKNNLLFPKNKYIEELGKKRSSTIPERDRHKVYKVAEWYQEYLRKENRFDEIDLARMTLQVIKKVNYDRYHLIVCDEVQDFTELQLKLLVSLAATDGNLFFAGDLHQMISPSGFRWGDLKKNFFGRHKHDVPTEKILKFNFRSVDSLVNLANQVLNLRSRILKESIQKKEQPYSNYGENARLITAPLENLKPSLGNLNPEDAILVRSDENKQIFRKEFNSSFVFTIEEAKGLEFDTVFLVEFFKSHQLLWNKVFDSKRMLKESDIPELRLELNLLYVAVTRARRILNIWETEHSPVWNQEELINFVHSIDSESVKKDQIEPTIEMWVNRGIYYRDAGFYDQAIECFEKAGDEKLKLEVEVKLKLQARNYSEAVEILVYLQEWEQAAQIFERLMIWEKAAECWEQTGNSTNQKTCQAKIFENSFQWESAASLYEELGLQKDSNRCRLNLPKKPKIIDNSDILIQSASIQDVNVKSNKVERIVDEYNSCLHFNRGLEKFNSRDYRGSIKEYDKALYFNPLNLDAYINRGNAKAKLGDYLRAIEDYDTGIIQEAIFLEPKSDTYYMRSISKRALRKIDESFNDINKAIELDDNIPEYYYERGQIYLEMYNQGLANGEILDTSDAVDNFQMAANLYLQQNNIEDYQDSLRKISSIRHVDDANSARIVDSKVPSSSIRINKLLQDVKTNDLDTFSSQKKDEEIITNKINQSKIVPKTISFPVTMRVAWELNQRLKDEGLSWFYQEPTMQDLLCNAVCFKTEVILDISMRTQRRFFTYQDAELSIPVVCFHPHSNIIKVLGLKNDEVVLVSRLEYFPQIKQKATKPQFFGCVKIIDDAAYSYGHVARHTWDSIDCNDKQENSLIVHPLRDANQTQEEKVETFIERSDLGISVNRVFINVDVCYINEDGEEEDKEICIALLRNGESYDDRINHIIDEKFGDRCLTVQWMEPD